MREEIEPAKKMAEPISPIRGVTEFFMDSL